ncbi:Ig-like domain-containing protein [Pseudomonas panipatensis]|uniref:Ig-like domain (Group 3) n=1 Tax=Pseudomonas panipatensis TaxID=428992 RepID=A0A1G8FJ97_9PSED|nr:Ig-like domain-containing protein [Pseudomonas panipatensis]SDH82185.1 Ig-like domain (group 3) [Pseudomonas panipatensis]SMP53303.1 Ig-like domain (group 3) [Pseudomonas panipatensis]
MAENTVNNEKDLVQATALPVVDAAELTPTAIDGSVAAAPLALSVSALTSSLQTPRALPPTIGSVLDDNGSIQGPLQQNAYTDDQTPTLSGSGLSVGQVVSVYDNGARLGSVRVKADGTWNYNPTTPLNEGVHTFTVSIDNGVTFSAPFTLHVDITAPNDVDQLLVVDAVGSITGVIDDNGATDDRRPVISGHAQVGDGNTVLVKIYADGNDSTPIGSASVDAATGKWSFTPPADLADGQHSFSFVAVDAAGTPSGEPFADATPSVSFSVDTTPPPPPPTPLSGSEDLIDDVGPVTGTIAKGGMTDDARPTFEGKLQSDSDAVMVKVYDGNTLIGSALVNAADKSWRFEPASDLVPGPHSFSLSTVDAVGNESARNEGWDFTLVDTSVPLPAPVIGMVLDDHGSVSGPLASGDVTDDQSLSVSGTGLVGNTVVLYVDGQPAATAQVDGNGNWQAELPIAGDGAKEITAKLQDGAGRLSPASTPLDVTLDTTAPAKPSDVVATDDVGPVTGPIANGGTTDDTTPTLSGKGEPGGVATISDDGTVLGTALVDGNGNWSFTPDQPLADGPHSLSVTVSDRAGNTGPASDALQFNVESVLPTVNIAVARDAVGSITGDVLDNGATDDKRPTLIGTATANGLVTVHEGAVVLGSVQADANGDWSLRLPQDQSDGAHTYTATVTNAAGKTASDDFTLTVDSQAPARPSIGEVLDDVGAIQGPLSAGAATDDTRPTVQGHDAEPNSLVTVYDNGAPIGSVQADNNGVWSLDLPTLADGPHSLSVTATDAVGNVSQPSAPFAFDVDTVPPQQTVIDRIEVIDDVGPVTGVIADGGKTDDAQPEIRGHVQGSDASSVQVFDGTTLLGTALIDANGNWSLVSPVLASGAHQIEARPLDVAGNPGAMTTPIAFELVDAPTMPLPSAPSIAELLDDHGSVTGPLHSGERTDDSSLTVSGTADANTTVVLFVNGQAAASVAVDASGTWQTELPLSGDGDKAITAKAQDAYGRQGPASNELDVTLDTTAPAKPGPVLATDDVGPVTGPIANGSTTDDTTPTLSGKGEPGGVATISDDGTVLGTALVDGNGDWSFTPDQPLADGPHSISATVSDVAGNTSPASDALQFGVQGVPPMVSITAARDAVGSITGDVLDNGVTDDRRPTLVGTASANGLVVIKEGPVVYGSAVADANGDWQLRLPLNQSEGEHTYTASLTSATGQTASAEFNLTVDSVAPTRPSIDAVMDDVGPYQGLLSPYAITDDANPTVQGSDAEPDSLVKVYDNGVLIGSVQADANGEWSLDLPTLADGLHKLAVSATDAAGNTSLRSAAFNFTVDTAAPTSVIDKIELLDDVGPVTGAIVNGTTTDDTQPELRGHVQGSDASAVAVYDDGILLGVAAIDSRGNWSFTSPDLLAGEHRFSARPLDKAGNAGQASATIDFWVDDGSNPLPSAPTIDEAYDDQGSITGPLSAGQHTDDSSLTVSGTADANTTVLLFVNGQAVASVAVDATGTWQTELPLSGDGAKEITAKAQDAAGRQGPLSSPLDVVLDTTAPAKPSNVVATDDVGQVTGPIANGSTTDDTTPTLSGKGEPGTVATISDGGTLLGSALVDGNGNWSFTPDQPLNEGPHSLSATLTDAAGNTGPASDPLQFGVETLGATVSIRAVLDAVGSITGEVQNGGVTDDPRPILLGNATANALVIVSEGAVVYGSVVADANGDWSLRLPLRQSDGEHTYSALAKTSAGDTANADFSLTVDTLAPARPGIVTVLDDVGGIQGPLAPNALTDDSQPTLQGHAGAAGDRVEVYDNGTLLGTALADANGDWTFTPAQPLADGPHAFTARASDEAGNTSLPSATFALTIDSVAPAQPSDVQAIDNVGSVTGPIASGGVTDDATPTLTGKGEPGSLANVSDNGTLLGSALVDANGDWSFTPSTPLAEGAHSLSATLTDKAGNTSPASDTLDFSVELTAPSVTIVALRDDVGAITGNIAQGGVTDDTLPSLTGMASGAVAVLIFDGQTLLGSVAVQADGSWQADALTPFAEGPHTLNVVAQSAAGVQSAPVQWDFTVDTQAPAGVTGLQLIDDVGRITGPIAHGGVTDDARPTFSGQANGADLVQVYDGQTLLGSAAVQADGSWAFTPNAPLAEGNHALSAVAMDTAGNQSAPSAEWKFDVDLTAPGNVINLDLYDDAGKVVGTVANGGVTDDSKPFYSGQVDSPDAVLVYIYDKGMLWGSATVDSQTSEWGYLPYLPLDSGQHSFQAQAMDAAGNLGPLSAAWNFFLDGPKPKAPAITNVVDDFGTQTGYLQKEDYTDDTTPTINGTGAAGAVLTLYANDVAVASQIIDARGNWTVTTSDLTSIAHADGSVNLVAKSVNSAGVAGPATGGYLIYLGNDPDAPMPAAFSAPSEVETQSLVQAKSLTLASVSAQPVVESSVTASSETAVTTQAEPQVASGDSLIHHLLSNAGQVGQAQGEGSGASATQQVSLDIGKLLVSQPTYGDDALDGMAPLPVTTQTAPVAASHVETTAAQPIVQLDLLTLQQQQQHLV